MHNLWRKGQRKDSSTLVHGRSSPVLLQHDNRKANTERSSSSSFIPHLCVKYPLPNGKIGSVRGDQAMARKCYAESVKVKTVHKSRTGAVGLRKAMERSRSNPIGSSGESDEKKQEKKETREKPG